MTLPLARRICPESFGLDELFLRMPICQAARMTVKSKERYCTQRHKGHILEEGYLHEGETFFGAYWGKTLREMLPWQHLRKEGRKDGQPCEHPLLSHGCSPVWTTVAYAKSTTWKI